uniref:Extracellular Endonuclease subunit A domain-containing protein n=1 Tax=Parascaris univalens TaxID=6257 RepID=A0A915BGR6_PARUN
MPIRYDYRGSPRIGDIIIEGRPGVLLRLENDVEWSKKRLGDHGYDNREPSVLAIFGAFGPSIAGKKHIDLLSIPASPNNGTYGVFMLCFAIHQSFERNVARSLTSNGHCFVIVNIVGRLV